MRPLRLLGLLALVPLGLFARCSGTETATQSTPALPAVVDFNFHVKPILSDRCFKCHGPDEKTREAGFRLDTREGALAALMDEDGNPTDRYAIVPGAPDRSELVARIHHTDPEERMPPADSKLSLSPNEIAILERWIAQGADWKEHWAFTPPAQAPLPDVRAASWSRNEIDRFVLARLERERLDPADEEAPEIWLRRVSLDITGLPPSLGDLDAFLADPSPEAYERTVDRLLASPAYGERMATVWLDAARYADSHGYQDDRPRTMWPWRDWVVRAFNENLPYDDFITWQLAGDLLPEATYEQKLATAFNRNHGVTQEGGVVNEEYITEYVADRTNTATTALLGVTMECARCHDHKYDPISQKDYYSLFAFFNTIDERGQISYFDLAPAPNLRVEDPALEARADSVRARIARLEARVAERAAAPSSGFADWEMQGLTDAELERGLSEGLIVHLPLDALQEGIAANAAGAPARINTRLLNVLDPPAVVEGREGQAFAFDGHNYLDAGDAADFEHASAFSIGAWIRYEGSGDRDAALVVKRNEEQKRGGYQLALTKDRRLQFSLIHDQGKERLDVATSARVPEGTWVHVAATYDGSGRAAGVRLYVDGDTRPVAVVNDALDRRSILNGNELLVGNWNTRDTPNGQLEGFRSGAIDEVRVYGRTLSALEVARLAGGRPLTRISEALPRETFRDALYDYYLLHDDAEYRGWQTALDSLRRINIDIPYVSVMAEMAEPRITHVLARGAYDAPTTEVTPGTPASILPFPDDYPRNRLGLARWMTHPDNPLTARVLVNRVWAQFFGRGIVATPEDFGSQGALPTHPLLLDWLAVWVQENGWDMKALVKKIALSATYRQAARITPEKLARDPQNLLLARGPSQRMTAEMLRDNVLAQSGLLNSEVGGWWVKPYQPADVWKELANQIGENKYRPSQGRDLYRRSLYSYWKRTIPPPAMLTFDAAERTVCVVKRQSTTTPLQSLVLLNDPQFIEASRVLATRVLRGGEPIVDAFRMATSRAPTERERALLDRLYQEEYARFAATPADAEALLRVGTYGVDPAADPTELAAMTVVVSTLLNLDEAKMRS
ncbi:MAG: DUF1553 domain-containing protein [Rhodothermales bacterium]